MPIKTKITGPVASGKTTRLRKLAGEERIFVGHEEASRCLRLFRKGGEYEGKTMYVDELRAENVAALHKLSGDVKIVAVISGSI